MSESYVVYLAPMPRSIEGILIPGFVYFAGVSGQPDEDFGVYSQLSPGAHPARGARYHGSVSRMHLSLPYEPPYPFEVYQYESNAIGCVDCYVWRSDYDPATWAFYHVWDISDPSQWWEGGDYRFVGVRGRCPIWGRTARWAGLTRFYELMRPGSFDR